MKMEENVCLSLRFSFLLFKIDNFEMIKCRYATTEQQKQKKGEKKNHPLFWLMPACQLREFLYIFDTVLKDTFPFFSAAKT